MKRLISVVMVLALVTIVSSCAAFNKLVKNDMLISQLAVSAATARILHDHPSWKVATVRITQDAMDAIANKAVTNLASVEEFVKSFIDMSKLSPEEQVLISTVLQKVVKNLSDTFLAKGLSDPNGQLVVVNEVLGWINDTAKTVK
jgi:hypothetical protein